MPTSLKTRLVCLALIPLALVSAGWAQGTEGQAAVIWVAMDGGIKLSRVAPGTRLDGRLARSLYWRDTEVLPQGSSVRLVIDQIARRKKAHSADGRPFVVHLFAPRHEIVARFRSVRVLTPEGREIPLQATFISFSQRAKLRAESPKHGGRPATGPGRRTPKAPSPKPAYPWVLTLQVEPEGTTFPALAAALAGTAAKSPEPYTDHCDIAEGTRVSLVLLQGLNARRDHPGQAIEGVVLEPVRVGSAVAIPQGSILQGVLSRSVPPRRLYRPGSLALVFTRLALPNGAATAIAASPVGAEVEKGTHLTMDREGRIHAESPGKARFLLDFGVTGGISKVADDTTQLIIEAVSSTATDASTAGVARLAAMGATGIFLLTRHGRDVILPAYTELDVSLNRAVTLGDDSSFSQAPK